MAISAITIKRDKTLLAFAALLTGVTGILIYTGVVTPKEGLGFLIGALALPGLLGTADVTAEDPTTATTVPPPPPTDPEVHP